MVRRVLIVSYYFPPRPGVASLRIRGLTRYLHEYGWEPVVLTAELPDRPEHWCEVVQTPYQGDITDIWKMRLGLKRDMGLQEQIGIPRSLREGKASPTTKIISLVKSLVSYPDEQKKWCPLALEAGIELMKDGKFNAILSSSGPVTCHIVASHLRKIYGVPWIADFRDLWTQNHYYPYGRARLALERRLEINTLRYADALVTVSEPLAEKLRSLHHGRLIMSIPNGFDPDEVVTSPLTKEFTITYTGQLYQGKRDPSPLFKAIKELITEGKIDRHIIKIRFYGPKEYWLEKRVQQLSLEDIVELHERVPRNIALEKQRESQILLLLNWDDPDEAGVYTGKIFEYVAARRPMLAIGGPRGVVTDLLEDICAGTHAIGYEQLKRALLSFYEQYRSFGYVPYAGREERIVKYSHREMARRFASLMDELCEKRLSAKR